MKKLLLLSSASVLALSVGAASLAPANAADLRQPAYKAPPPAPPPVVFSWTGCYVGAHTGWGWGRKNGSSPGNDVCDLEDSGFKVTTSGALFGAQLGCDYQFGWGKAPGTGGTWVIGIRGTVAGTDINGVWTENSNDFSGERFAVKQDWLSSVTGRLGWAGWNNQVLFYVQGGGAWAHDRYEWMENTAGDNHEALQANSTRSGWTVGVGVEWAWSFAPGWSSFVEWNYYDFGNKTIAFNETTCEVCESERISQKLQTVMVGVNYRFNFLGKSPVAARY